MIPLLSLRRTVPLKCAWPQPPVHRRESGSPRLTGRLLANLIGATVIGAGLVGLSGIGTAVAEDRPPALQLCFDDDPNNKPTLFALLDGVSARLAVRFDIVRVPWARCLLDVQSGDRDGAIGASYLPERDAFGVFPRDAGGQPDPTKRLSTEGYYLYTAKDSDLDWNGSQLLHLTGSVAVKINASIITKLKSLGAPVIEVNSDWASLFEMVIANHAQATAMLSDRGDRILNQNSDVSDKIRKIPLALQEKPYYLMFSHQFQNAHPDLTRQMWATIESVRNAPVSQPADAKTVPQGRPDQPATSAH